MPKHPGKPKHKRKGVGNTEGPNSPPGESKSLPNLSGDPRPIGGNKGNLSVLSKFQKMQRDNNIS